MKREDFASSSISLVLNETNGSYQLLLQEGLHFFEASTYGLAVNLRLRFRVSDSVHLCPWVSLGSSSEGATRAPLTPTGVRRVGCVSLCFVLRSVGSSASVQLSARNELPLRTFWSMKSPRVAWRAFGNVFG